MKSLVIDKEKLINQNDFISIGEYSFYYKDDGFYCSTMVQVSEKLNYIDSYEQAEQLIYPKFNRNTRVQYQIPEIELEIQQPIQKPQKPKKNILMSLIPALVMLAMTIVLRGIMGGGGTFVIYSVVSMSIGVVMSVITYFQDNKAYKKEYEERIEQYNKYIDEKKQEIVAAREKELRARNLIYESIDNSINEVDNFGRRLFEKSAEDKDFLQVYLGKGRIESSNDIKYTKQEFADLEDPLSQIAENISKEFKYIENAPIISDFKASSGIGVVGTQAELEQVLRNMTIDIAIRHFYSDVRFVYILRADEISNFSWIRWLHNVENTQLDVRNIVCDEESKNVILENLYSILSLRELQVQENKDTVFDEEYVIFITDSSAISKYPVSKYVKNCDKLGFTFVFFENYEEKLPQGCTEIIRISDAQVGRAIKSIDGDIVSEFKYPEIGSQTASEIAKKLGAVTVDEVNLESQLTKNISMFELLQIISVDDLRLDDRWNNSVVYKSMAAPLGVKNKGKVVYLDISDKSNGHGPHGLVAGTTGSGKSEILQTYILSMATLFHPYEVGFVIIDFKGGGMANQFKNLPHLIGTITNIDGREINRSLLSIKAELIRRQELFSENGVNHINDYIKLYKSGKALRPLPHLIMIVDEFAELKAEHPDFMKELISAARIGRTLGVHLILATQKPAGVVDAQIWSNSKFKLCLKVQTKEDSNEVIKTPLAAEIVEPGRAYFQVGNNEIFDLFQSAYSGGNVPSGSDANEQVFSIYELNVWGKKTLKYTNKKSQKSSETKTQLQAIVEYVFDYCKAQNIDKLSGICLPSLKDIINTKELDYSEKNVGYAIPIGVFDDPEQQRQGEVKLDVAKENIYIVGSPQMGKTVMLQTIIYGLIKNNSPKEVNMYLIDCGSMVLKIFEDSYHVGGVVLSNEEEKCKNLFKLLNTIVLQRKKILSAKGVGNYAAYFDAGYNDLPMVVVVIDNMAAFKEYFPDQAEEINILTREAQGVGISFIVTAASSNALNYRIQSNFGKKFVLNCNDENEYSNMFGHCKETPKEVAGRGLFVLDKRILEFQAAMFGDGLKEAQRSQELRDYITARNDEYKIRAQQIPMIPEKLLLSECMENNSAAFKNKRIIPIGMDFTTVDFSLLNLNYSGSLALIGDTESKEKFIANFVKAVSGTIIYHGMEATIIDDKTKKMKSYESLGFVTHYTADVADGMSLVLEFCDDVKQRKENDELEGFVVLILNNQEVFRRICLEKREGKSLSDAIKSANEANAFILFANVDNQPVGFNSSEVMKTIKDEKQGIAFLPISEVKIFDISGRAKTDSLFDNTMGYRFDGSTYSKIKIFD
ncbi:MAG: type VII secretion protein EssC [Oscillospiraceae bacterium]